VTVSRPAVDELVEGVLAGDRVLLARAITLVESVRSDHRAQAEQLLEQVMPATGRAHRVGLTGVPGAGKSTVLDELGTRLTGRGHRVAVLAVDPTSIRTKGSILGDKTRMDRLAVDPAAFIRPSPTSGTLGGVASMTREAMLLCEAAGHDVVFVETVGVGQSEVTVADMVDVFCVLTIAGAGDQLQGIKKGVIEIADVIAVNKADGDDVDRAQGAAADLSSALHLVGARDDGWQVPVLTCSGRTGDGIDELWGAVVRHRAHMEAAGEWSERRAAQQVRWLWSVLSEELMRRFRDSPAVAARLAAEEDAVRAGTATPTAAARRLLDGFC
jgi:LAO/AO transport system kinase